MTKSVTVISTQDVTVFPNELLFIAARTSEEVPDGYIAKLSPLSTLPSRLRVSNPTVFSDKFEVAVANFDDGPYWDGITSNLNGDLYDMDGELLPKGFFRKDDKYSISYEIKKGDVFAVATIIKNGKQKRGGENND